MSDSSSQPYTAPFFIKYNPALRSEFGSQNAVILFDRLEYWFSKKKNEFYKFIEPCQHGAYKTGDSWSEELGFSKKVFKTAFDKIGIRYISKTAFDKEDDPFKGKLFAYYQDRQTKKTIFVRNNALLKDLYAKLKSILQEKPSPKPIGEGTHISFKKGSPTARPLGSPHVRASKEIQRNTSSKKDDGNFMVDKSPVSEVLTEELQIAHDVHKVWEQEIGSKGLIKLNDNTSEKLTSAFKHNFQGSLELWRAHCIKIASSKFLMGEKQGTSFEIKILFAISKKFIDQLADGKYEVNTRESNHNQKLKALEEKVKSIAVKKEVLETQIVHLEDEKKASNKRFIAESRKNLSCEALETYKSSYEDLMLTDQSGQGSRFRENGWEDTQVQFMFDLFVDKELKKSLGQGVPASTEISQKETYLFETKHKLQNLYDMGIRALKEMRGSGKCCQKL